MLIMKLYKRLFLHHHTVPGFMPVSISITHRLSRQTTTLTFTFTNHRYSGGTKKEMDEFFEERGLVRCDVYTREMPTVLNKNLYGTGKTASGKADPFSVDLGELLLKPEDKGEIVDCMANSMLDVVVWVSVG